MGEIEIPNLAVLLARHIAPVAEAARPAILAGLERGAAGRYREWATRAQSSSPGLLACAKREEEIAERVDRLFPVEAGDQPDVEAALAAAKAAYLSIFDGLSLREQLTIQAGAERQGAEAWRSIASQQTDPVVSDELAICAGLEEQTAEFLDSLLEDAKIDLGP